jgi:hypothetical protein
VARAHRPVGAKTLPPKITPTPDPVPVVKPKIPRDPVVGPPVEPKNGVVATARRNGTVQSGAI